MLFGLSYLVSDVLVERFLTVVPRDPIENLLHSLMVEVKQGEEVVGLATMVLVHVRSTNSQVLLRMKDLRNEESKEDGCRGEVELLQEVQGKLEEIMDNAVKEQMMAASLAILANDLLKLKLEVEKVVMELMMAPETSEQVEGVCPRVHELEEEMAGTTCWRDWGNELHSGLPVPSFGRQESHGEQCYLVGELVNQLNLISEEAAQETASLLAQLRGSHHVTEDSEGLVVRLEVLESIMQATEGLARVVSKEAPGLEVVKERVAGLVMLCEQGQGGDGEEEGDCLAAEYRQSRSYLDTLDSTLMASKKAMGKVEEVQRVVVEGLLHLLHQLDTRVGVLVTRHLCCTEEVDATKLVLR